MARLFEPFRLKDVTLRNRVVVSPMCQYSSVNGRATDWHLVHLGSMARGGAGLVIAEATAVSPEGRISPRDAGLWEDAQIEPLRRIVAFVKEQGAVPGIQLAHAGRKASANRPWEGDDHLTPQEGAWETLAPSAKAFGEKLPQVPKEMTKADIARVKGDFVAAARRAREAGYEWLELHFAHGYLAHSFYSPLSNARTDEYGGSFENRVRFLIETFEAVRDAWPERLPLTVRLALTDWVDGGVPVDESIELTRRLKASGLDLLDASLGFAVPDVSRIPWGPGFLLPYAGRLRKEAGVPVAGGWFINEPEQAEAALKEGQADLIVLGHAMLDDPHWAYHAAKKLGVEQPTGLLPPPYGHWLQRR
ncbi:NADH:flavin oxidoreductase/NADH oxidase [Sorangium cellulosum]|uniref:NADH:flavin oxidoreductase/NADH oxidase n=1 Tax=Sorangium cellulosum TaxID=56 RepID=UPI003D9A0CAF